MCKFYYKVFFLRNYKVVGAHTSKSYFMIHSIFCTVLFLTSEELTKLLLKKKHLNEKIAYLITYYNTSFEYLIISHKSFIVKLRSRLTTFEAKMI